MSDTNRRIAGLIFKYIEGELQGPEKTELEVWLDKSEHNSLKFHELTHSRKLAKEVEQLREFEMDKKSAWLKMLEKGLPEAENSRRLAWKRYAAAAAVVLLSVSGVWLWRGRKQDAIASIKNTTQQLIINVPPGHFGALLTLSNGKIIVLDSASTGRLTTEGKASITKTDSGALVYAVDQSIILAKNLTNTLSTLRGRTFSVTLPDGTKVWLNASSSITYPVAFAGDRRQVSITGEAYFEVTKDASRPFTVSIGVTQIQVLGTQFNVNGYADEPTINTTLLEGAVKIKQGDAIQILKPGQQAQLNTSRSAIKLVENADVDEALAWKNGSFQFASKDMETIMRQISRWYDIDVVYEGPKPTDLFSGDIDRSNNLSDVLKILKLNQVHFIAAGRKLIVKD